LLQDEAGTEACARALAPLLNAGDVVALWGDLGAGKTVFARALVQALAGLVEVPSPTFNLVLTYEPQDPAAPMIWHFDLYRLEKADEAFELGIEEAFDEAISVIEWPGNLGHYLPTHRIDVSLRPGPDKGQRAIEIAAPGPLEARFEQAMTGLGFEKMNREQT
jgi:tRNA threonylcarbamoyladenosine biosynthesis protein TsaE